PPPSSTLFPYTTLFRSEKRLPNDALRLPKRRAMARNGIPNRFHVRPERNPDVYQVAVPDARHVSHSVRSYPAAIAPLAVLKRLADRKSTRLNSSHLVIS